MTPSTKHCLPALLIFALAAPALADAPKAQKAVEWDYLRDAYKTLSLAKKDYNGHRKKAMEAIESACDKLKHDVRGENRSKEPQEVSDDQLREARHQLDQARMIVDARHQVPVTRNIEEAIRQVDLALSTK